MTISRRGALFGLIAAPAIIRTPGLLMPVKAVRPVRMVINASATNRPTFVLQASPDGVTWANVEQQSWANGVCRAPAASMTNRFMRVVTMVEAQATQAITIDVRALVA